MMLHGVQSVEEFEKRRGCLEALLEAKAAGKVRHVSASTHRASGAVMEAMAVAEDIEVVLSVLNKTGVGLEGDLETHKRLLRAIHEAGKGVMIMKLMDEGKVPDEDAEEWIGWGFEFPHAHSVNLGLTSEEEIDTAVRLGSPLPVG
jgi:predicted aldo/keto reductase-like oxidoreductase